MPDNAAPDDIAAIRAEAQRLAQEEAAALPAEKKPEPITHRFVADCAKASDKGCGMLFAALFRDKFIATPVGKIPWHAWQGHYWKRVYDPIVRAAVERVAERFAEALQEERSRLGQADPEDVEARKGHQFNMGEMRKRINTLHKRDGVTSCLSFAVDNDDPLLVDPDALDQAPYRIACENGVVDLRTGERRDGSPRDYITKFCPCPWTGIETPAPRFEKMLAEIFGSEDVARYFQKLIGYALGGKITEKLFLILLGEDGDSGKTTIFEILFKILGAYASPMPVEYLLDQGGAPRNPDAPAPVMLGMRGTRLTWASEPGKDRRFSVDRIKLMSGNDSLEARGPYDIESTKFDPTHTLFVLTNHKMRADASDTAFWSRVRLLECPFSFVQNPVGPLQKKRDPTLKDVILATESSGVLAWIVRGHMLYQAEGLDPPQTVSKATETYRTEEDPIAEFLASCLDAKEGLYETVADMYEAFRNWHAEYYGKKGIPTKIGFGKHASRFKAMKKVTVGGEQRWLDVRLKKSVADRFLKDHSV